MKSLRKAFACLATVVITIVFIAETKAQVQTPRYFSIIHNAKAFYEYLPQGYNTETTKSYPLLIFVHGIGELGEGTPESLPGVLLNGPPRIIKDGKFPNSFKVRGEEFKFIVISPQFTSWPVPDQIEDLIEACKKRYRVDASRIYLTGLSMGGGVVWNYASQKAEYANSLSAIVPVCGVDPSNETKGGIIASSNLPVWATHNDGDQTVELKNTENYIYFINNSKPPPNPLAKKTIFKSNSHDAWSVTYDPSFKENGMNVYEWMLQYKRGEIQAPPPPNQAPTANAGGDISITLPTSSVSLGGSGSDGDGNVVKYSWARVSGPTQFTISNASIANPTLSNLVEGEYAFELTVTDNDNAADKDQVLIRVNAAPAPPPVVAVTVPGIVQAENYFAMSGVQIQSTTDAGGGSNVGAISAGDWMDYRINVATAGSYFLNLRVATSGNNQQFQVRNSAGTVLAVVNVPRTGGNQTYTIAGAVVTLPAGVQTLRFYSLTGDWSINWAEYSRPNSGKPIPGKIQAEDYTNMNGVQLENTSDTEAGKNVGWIDTGDWMDYNVDVAHSGNYTVRLRVATPYYNQRFQIRKANGTVLATVNLTPTGGNQTWTTVNTNVNLDAGNQTLRIHSLQSGWNINWVEFVVTPAYLPVPGIVDATSFSAMLGIGLENSYDEGGGWNIGWIDNGDWMDYTINAANAATYKAIFRVATPYLGQRFQVKNAAGAVLATVNVPITGGNQFWTTVSTNITLPKGNQTLRIQSLQSGWNIRRIEFTTDLTLSAVNTDNSTLVGIEEGVVQKPSIAIFPNPVRNQANLKVYNDYTGPMEVQVIAASGSVSSTYKFAKDHALKQVSIPVKGLPAGTYLLRIQMKERTEMRKMIKL